MLKKHSRIELSHSPIPSVFLGFSFATPYHSLNSLVLVLFERVPNHRKPRSSNFELLIPWQLPRLQLLTTCKGPSAHTVTNGVSLYLWKAECTQRQLVIFGDLLAELIDIFEKQIRKRRLRDDDLESEVF